MALELYPDSWAGWHGAASPGAAAAASPRISFSRDLESPTILDHHHHHHSHPQQRTDSSLLESSSDFDFYVSSDRPGSEFSSAADDLFSDGFLLPLPLPVAPKGSAATFPCPHTPATPATSSVGGGCRPPVMPLPPPEVEETRDVTDEKVTGAKHHSSFWRFGRSTSLNFSGSGGGGSSGGRRGSLICSLPLLYRSKSTGSNPSTPGLKQRQQPLFNTTSIATAAAGGGTSKLSRKGSGNGSSAARNSYYYGQQQHGGGGVRISPVLNVSPPYIPKGSGSGLFSFGHLLCNSSSRERSRKKTRQ